MFFFFLIWLEMKYVDSNHLESAALIDPNKSKQKVPSVAAAL